MLFNSRLIILLLCILCTASCTTQLSRTVVLVLGQHHSTAEALTARDLMDDIEMVTGANVLIQKESTAIPDSDTIILIGTPQSHQAIKRLAHSKAIKLSAEVPGPRGGIWARARVEQKNVIVLAGSDIQGMQYAVYDFSHAILGIDPLSYWTGYRPPINTSLDLYRFEPRVIAPPRVPILTYFENDVDELANLKKPYLEYDWESYTAMIDTLIRLRYNAIELFDMLGRPEFYVREEYKKIRPDYHLDLAYLNKMIDYARAKGMLMQVDMMLGKHLKSITEEQADCWSEHKDAWIQTWRYYLTQTPLKKGDIFTLRPRHQIWDWPYKSSCGENKTQVFNEVFAALDKVIDEFKPGAPRVCVCYADGMEMFNGSFSPPKSFIIAWPDNGWGDFDLLPESTKGFEFGTYMHAGFWLNHDVHDPYPEKVDENMKMMFERFGADKYLMVNGQTFRHFLINLEAFSQVAYDPARFDGEIFYRQWVGRYFAPQAVGHAVVALKALHQAQFKHTGYVQHLWEIRNAVAYLTDSPIQRPRRTPIAVDFDQIEPVIAAVRQRVEILKTAEAEALLGQEKARDKAHFYYDHITLPIRLYLDLLDYERELHELAVLKQRYRETGKEALLETAKQHLDQARTNLEELHQRRREGDKNPRWKSWYYPEKRRPNNGFPTTEEFALIEKNLMAGWRGANPASQ